MPAARILVVAASASARGTIADALRASGGCSFVSTAADVDEALSRMREIPYDFVTVARATCTRTSRFAVQAREVSAGATVIVHADETVASIEREVLPRLPRRVTRPAGGGLAGVEVVAIGASTGGPVALTTLLGIVRDRLPVPILMVQHMPVGFTGPFAERLTRTCGLTVREGYTSAAPVAGEAWLAPADHHMVVKRVDGALQIVLYKGAPENSCRPAVDVLFRSVATHCGARSLGVVLTGMGQDGLQGSRALVERSAQVWVQDEASSVVWGMPGSIARAGIATRVLSVPELAQELLAKVGPPGHLSAERFGALAN